MKLAFFLLLNIYTVKSSLLLYKMTVQRYLGYAKRQLRRLGARRVGFGFRGSFALVGSAKRGRKPSWIRQDQRTRKRGPSSVSVRIRLGRAQKGEED